MAPDSEIDLNQIPGLQQRQPSEDAAKNLAITVSSELPGVQLDANWVVYSSSPGIQEPCIVHPSLQPHGYFRSYASVAQLLHQLQEQQLPLPGVINQRQPTATATAATTAAATLAALKLLGNAFRFISPSSSTSSSPAKIQHSPGHQKGASEDTANARKAAQANNNQQKSNNGSTPSTAENPSSAKLNKLSAGAAGGAQSPPPPAAAARSKQSPQGNSRSVSAGKARSSRTISLLTSSNPPAANGPKQLNLTALKSSKNISKARHVDLTAQSEESAGFPQQPASAKAAAGARLWPKQEPSAAGPSSAHKRPLEQQQQQGQGIAPKDNTSEGTCRWMLALQLFGFASNRRNSPTGTADSALAAATPAAAAEASAEGDSTIAGTATSAVAAAAAAAAAAVAGRGSVMGAGASTAIIANDSAQAGSNSRGKAGPGRQPANKARSSAEQQSEQQQQQHDHLAKRQKLQHKLACLLPAAAGGAIADTAAAASGERARPARSKPQDTPAVAYLKEIQERQHQLGQCPAQQQRQQRQSVKQQQKPCIVRRQKLEQVCTRAAAPAIKTSAALGANPATALAAAPTVPQPSVGTAPAAAAPAAAAPAAAAPAAAAPAAAAPAAAAPAAAAPAAAAPAATAPAATALAPKAAPPRAVPSPACKPAAAAPAPTTPASAATPKSPQAVRLGVAAAVGAAAGAAAAGVMFAAIAAPTGLRPRVRGPKPGTPAMAYLREIQERQQQQQLEKQAVQASRKLLSQHQQYQRQQLLDTKRQQRLAWLGLPDSSNNSPNGRSRQSASSSSSDNPSGSLAPLWWRQQPLKLGQQLPDGRKPCSAAYRALCDLVSAKIPGQQLDSEWVVYPSKLNQSPRLDTWIQHPSLPCGYFRSSKAVLSYLVALAQAVQVFGKSFPVPGFTVQPNSSPAQQQKQGSLAGDRKALVAAAIQSALDAARGGFVHRNPCSRVRGCREATAAGPSRQSSQRKVKHHAAGVKALAAAGGVPGIKPASSSTAASKRIAARYQYQAIAKAAVKGSGGRAAAAAPLPKVSRKPGLGRGKTVGFNSIGNGTFCSSSSKTVKGVSKAGSSSKAVKGDSKAGSSKTGIRRQPVVVRRSLAAAGRSKSKQLDRLEQLQREQQSRQWKHPPVDRELPLPSNGPVLVLGMFFASAAAANHANSHDGMAQNRDRARLLALQQEGKYLPHSFNRDHEESLAEGKKHTRGNFNCSRGARDVNSRFPNMKFQAIFLDYFRIPSGYAAEMYKPQLFTQFIPELVRVGAADPGVAVYIPHNEVLLKQLAAAGAFQGYTEFVAAPGDRYPLFAATAAAEASGDLKGEYSNESEARELQVGAEFVVMRCGAAPATAEDAG